MLLSTLQLFAGLGILIVGGHFLVEGAVRIALLARLRPSVVGLTVVAMGTSMPEMAVSLGAAFRDATDVAYGNVVGSNIFNIAFILGLIALIRPIPTTRQTVRLEYPFMLLALGVQLLVVRDGVIDRLEGLFFLGSLVVFIAFLVYISRGELEDAETAEAARELASSSRLVNVWGINIGRVLLGVAGLAAGADLMVRGAVSLAEMWHISGRVIGLTIVAIGTSLPELATSLVAARKGQSEIAIGNLVGSNIFNTLGILGVTAALVGIPINPDAIRVDNWVMLGVCALLFPMMSTRRLVGRIEGGVLLASYVAYLGWLILG